MDSKDINRNQITLSKFLVEKKSGIDFIKKHIGEDCVVEGYLKDIKETITLDDEASKKILQYGIGTINDYIVEEAIDCNGKIINIIKLKSEDNIECPPCIKKENGPLYMFSTNHQSMNNRPIEIQSTTSYRGSNQKLFTEKQWVKSPEPKPVLTSMDVKSIYENYKINSKIPPDSFKCPLCGKIHKRNEGVAIERTLKSEYTKTTFKGRHYTMHYTDTIYYVFICQKCKTKMDRTDKSMNIIFYVLLPIITFIAVLDGDGFGLALGITSLSLIFYALANLLLSALISFIFFHINYKIAEECNALDSPSHH